jgi:hypothetical protein
MSNSKYPSQFATTNRFHALELQGVSQPHYFHSWIGKWLYEKFSTPKAWKNCMGTQMLKVRLSLWIWSVWSVNSGSTMNLFVLLRMLETISLSMDLVTIILQPRWAFYLIHWIPSDKMLFIYQTMSNCFNTDMNCVGNSGFNFSYKSSSSSQQWLKTEI